MTRIRHNAALWNARIGRGPSRIDRRTGNPHYDATWLHSGFAAPECAISGTVLRGSVPLLQNRRAKSQASCILRACRFLRLQLWQGFRLFQRDFELGVAGRGTALRAVKRDTESRAHRSLRSSLMTRTLGRVQKLQGCRRLTAKPIMPSQKPGSPSGNVVLPGSSRFFSFAQYGDGVFIFSIVKEHDSFDSYPVRDAQKKRVPK
jgi:hypothetical protein